MLEYILKMLNDEDLINSIKDIFLYHELDIDENNLVYSYEGDTEREEIRNFYNNKTWEEVLENKEFILGSHISFLTPMAIAMYIPAFMIYCLKSPEDADILISFLIWFLLDKNSINHFYTQKELEIFYSYLSCEQKKIIKKYIDYMCEKYPEDCS